MLEENESTQLTDQTGNAAETSGAITDIPQASENFGTMPHDAEPFGIVPNAAERRENHTLTVREVARMFEAAGVARTERSIINWCQPNRQAIARLDSYYEPNERKYYITPQSVETAIQEEIQRARKSSEAPVSETDGSPVEPVKQSPVAGNVANESKLKELELENLDLKITNRAKDFEINRMQKERERFFDQLLAATHKVGELETKLLQIEAPPKN